MSYFFHSKLLQQSAPIPPRSNQEHQTRSSASRHLAPAAPKRASATLQTSPSTALRQAVALPPESLWPTPRTKASRRRGRTTLSCRTSLVRATPEAPSMGALRRSWTRRTSTTTTTRWSGSVCKGRHSTPAFRSTLSRRRIRSGMMGLYLRSCMTRAVSWPGGIVLGVSRSIYGLAKSPNFAQQNSSQDGLCRLGATTVRGA